MIVLAFTMLSACAEVIGSKSEPTNYFVLSSLSPPQNSSVLVKERLELTVGLFPIKVPKYLETRSIVTRTDENEVFVDDFNKWAANLDDHVTAVLAENLATRLRTDRLVILPLALAIDMDLQILVRLNRFEREANSHVVLEANWVIINDRKGSDDAIGSSCWHITQVAGDYKATAAAMSQALSRLAETLATATRAMVKGGSEIVFSSESCEVRDSAPRIPEDSEVRVERPSQGGGNKAFQKTN